jgi:hypothetical protein
MAESCARCLALLNCRPQSQQHSTVSAMRLSIRMGGPDDAVWISGFLEHRWAPPRSPCMGRSSRPPPALAEGNSGKERVSSRRGIPYSPTVRIDRSNPPASSTAPSHTLISENHVANRTEALTARRLWLLAKDAHNHRLGAARSKATIRAAPVPVLTGPASLQRSRPRVKGLEVSFPP